MKSTTSKIRKITPEHEVLIRAINEENFAEVRAYLQQNNLSHLDFSGHKSGNLDIVKLGPALVGTAVSSLDLSRQDLDFEKVVTLCNCLKQTAVTDLKLSNTLFGQGEGIEAIFEALNGSPIKAIDLSQNHIPAHKVAVICGYIPQTNLEHVNLGFESSLLQRVLKENQEILTLLGYEAGLDEEITSYCKYFETLDLRLNQLETKDNNDAGMEVAMEKKRRNSL